MFYIGDLSLKTPLGPWGGLMTSPCASCWKVRGCALKGKYRFEVLPRCRLALHHHCKLIWQMQITVLGEVNRSTLRSTAKFEKKIFILSSRKLFSTIKQQLRHIPHHVKDQTEEPPQHQPYTLQVFLLSPSAIPISTTHTAHATPRCT